MGHLSVQISMRSNSNLSNIKFFQWLIHSLKNYVRFDSVKDM
ncbi:unnamed protein product [Prunus brigantina]